jgi:hypothetical protein
MLINLVRGEVRRRRRYPLLAVALCAIYWPLIASSQEGVPAPSEIRVLLQVSGSANIPNTLAPVLAQQLIASLRQSDPSISRQAQDVVAEVTLTYLRRRAEEDHLVDRLIPIYSKYLTKDDVRQLTEFYRSPVGKKLVSLSPQITAESAAIGRMWATSVLPGLQAELTKKLQQENLIN